MNGGGLISGNGGICGSPFWVVTWCKGGGCYYGSWLEMKDMVCGDGVDKARWVRSELNESGANRTWFSDEGGHRDGSEFELW
ncbi:hypothetical protein V6N13_074196 [Hibiscus sabdariffa]|uniref:Uncharacterized protein n=1 Tax=Hibiscus sabdariffa TaxID=183260 RepID=A0ABR2U813_9ROSI